MKFKNLKRFSFILTLVLILGVVSACSPKETDKEDTGENNPIVETEGFPKTIKDGFNNEVTIENEPKKIVSLAPNNTEILFALGLDEQIVGVSSADDYPTQALEKEKVGGFEGNNLEKIIELETDLVLSYGEMKTEDLDRLKESGIAVLAYMPESIDEVIETIKAIGSATGRDNKAKEITDTMIEEKDEIVEKIKDLERRTVFYEIGSDPLYTVGAGSFINEIITIAGGENIALDAEGAYPQYDLEALFENNPMVYIATDGDPNLTKEAIIKRPGYESLDAVKEDHVYIVDANLSSRPGPRIIEGLKMIAKAIHPDEFK